MYPNWHEKMDASVSSTPGLPESRRGRKRLRNEENWKKKEKKATEGQGKSYTTSKGVRKAVKQMVSISCRCTNKCRENVGDEERERIFTGFYELGSP